MERAIRGLVAEGFPFGNPVTDPDGQVSGPEAEPGLTTRAEPALTS